MEPTPQPTPEQVQVPTPADESTHHSRKTWIALAGLVIILALAAILFAVTKKHTVPESVSTDISEPTSEVISPYQAFIPKGFRPLEEPIVGDITNDGIVDVILPLHYIDEEARIEANNAADFEDKTFIARPLILLVGHSDGSYVIGARKDGMLLCGYCGGTMGDPYSGIVINPDGSFTVSHSGGSREVWSEDMTFSYKESTKQWFVAKFTESTIDRLSGNEDINPEKTDIYPNFSGQEFTSFDWEGFETGDN